MSAKSRKMSCPKLPLFFWKYFQKMGFSLPEWVYFLRSKNNVNSCFYTETI